MSVHKTEAECERDRDGLEEEARGVVKRDPNATALQVAAALGAIEAQCVEKKTPKVEAPDGKAPDVDAPGVEAPEIEAP